MNQSELQQDLQRFAGIVMDRMTQAGESITASESPELRSALLRRLLRYGAAVLDVATEPFPEVGILDMTALIRLGRASLDEYWIPDVFGETARPLSRALSRSEQDLRPIVAKLLAPAQRQQLDRVIETWRADNPELNEVEGVRLFSFSEMAGQLAAERAKQARGLLGTVKSATQSADQALLLAERAIFLAHRLPFLLRMQARLGAQEIMADSLASLGQAEVLIDKASELRPLVRDATALADSSGTAAKEARKLVDTLRPMLEAQGGREDTGARIDHLLSAANRLADKSLLLLDDVQALAPEGESPIAVMGRGADGLMRRGVTYAAIAGVVLIVLFWSGYIVAKRVTGVERPAQQYHATTGPAQLLAPLSAFNPGVHD